MRIQRANSFFFRFVSFSNSFFKAQSHLVDRKKNIWNHINSSIFGQTITSQTKNYLLKYEQKKTKQNHVQNIIEQKEKLVKRLPNLTFNFGLFFGCLSICVIDQWSMDRRNMAPINIRIVENPTISISRSLFYGFCIFFWIFYGFGLGADCWCWQWSSKSTGSTQTNEVIELQIHFQF